MSLGGLCPHLPTAGWIIRRNILPLVNLRRLLQEHQISLCNCIITPPRESCIAWRWQAKLKSRLLQPSPTAAVVMFPQAPSYLFDSDRWDKKRAGFGIWAASRGICCLRVTVLAACVVTGLVIDDGLRSTANPDSKTPSWRPCCV